MGRSIRENSQVALSNITIWSIVQPRQQMSPRTTMAVLVPYGLRSRRVVLRENCHSMVSDEKTTAVLSVKVHCCRVIFVADADHTGRPLAIFRTERVELKVRLLDVQIQGLREGVVGGSQLSAPAHLFEVEVAVDAGWIAAVEDLPPGGFGVAVV